MSDHLQLMTLFVIKWLQALDAMLQDDLQQHATDLALEPTGPPDPNRNPPMLTAAETLDELLCELPGALGHIRMYATHAATCTEAGTEKIGTRVMQKKFDRRVCNKYVRTAMLKVMKEVAVRCNPHVH